MSHKTRQILLAALLSLLIVALFAASFTYARYYKETGVTGGKYDDTIEFVGANKYIVYTPEELVAAIENGYSYIEIGEGAEEPFVITDGVTDVSANLVLDINGHNLVRNSRNPLIDVQENVSVVIVYDSESSGSFYNPVGSMLQASGGTLTIATGEFTSGPKAEDYVKDAGTTDKGVSYSLENYTVYYRDGYTPGATSPNRSAEYIDTGVEANLPKIVPVVIDSEAEDRYGNIYFENGIEGNAYIKEDTFLIYTEETVETPESATVTVDFEPLCDVASCDFYYYYETGTDGSGEDKTTTYAVIYGYNDVMAGAEKQITKTGFNTTGSINNNSADAVIWPYATVRMTQGEAFIRGGSYINRFGKAYSCGIYARGGSLSVQGESTSFTSVEDGVCIRCTTEDTAAPSLHIENGSFTSYNGDTVQVNGGTMTVESGTFTKTATKSGTQSAVIRMTGGELACSATAHDIVMTCGGAADDAGKESIYSNLYGIYSVGGTVALNNAKITVSGTYSAGILAEQEGSKVILQSVSIDLSGAQFGSEVTSAAVNTLGGSITLSGTNKISSDGFGITAVADETTAAADVSITGGTTIVGSEDAMLPTTAIYVFGGSLSVSTGATLSVHAEIDENLKWAGYEESTNAYQYDGVQVNGGSLVAEGTLNVEFTGVENESHASYDALKIRSYAVRVEQADADSGGETKVIIASGDITNSVGGGVYVGGGTVTLGDSKNNSGGPMIETTGTSFGSENTTAGAGNWKYYVNKTGGHAVEVNGGDLSVYNGLYTAMLGNGILVRGGDARIIDGVFQGNDTQAYRNNYGGDLPAGSAAYYALKLLGGSVTTLGGTFGTYTAADGTTHTAGGSSAFMTGVGDQAIANIYGGSFVVSGQAGFSVYQNVALTFTPNESVSIEETTMNGSSVKVSAATTAIAIENTTDRNVSVTINGGTFESTSVVDGNRDGIWYSNPYAKLAINQPAGQTTKISAKEQHGVRLVHAPNTTGGVTITGGTITGNQHGILYVDTGSEGKVANVNDGLLISGGTITGTNGSGLYFAANPWQSGSNNVAIIGGMFKGKTEKRGSNQNPYWTSGAISAPSTGYTNIDYSGLGKNIRLGDILKTHTGDIKVAYVERYQSWNGNSALGDDYTYAIARTVSSLESAKIVLQS